MFWHYCVAPYEVRRCKLFEHDLLNVNEKKKFFGELEKYLENQETKLQMDGSCGYLYKGYKYLADLFPFISKCYN